jgi:peptide/nickel transport system permease protein
MMKEGERVKWFMSELSKSKAGVLGLAMILILIGISAYTLAAVPTSDMEKWNQLDQWLDNPPSAPPKWINLLTGKSLPETYIVERRGGAATSISEVPELYSSEVTLNYDFHYDDFPSSLILSVTVLSYSEELYMRVLWERPDGDRITIIDHIFPSSPGDPPHKISERFYISTDPEVKMRLASFILEETGLSLYPEEMSTNRVLFLKLMQGRSVSNSTEPLKGTYKVRVMVQGFDSRDSIESAKLSIGGKVHGLAGTDSSRRDLLLGILWGTPVALMVGLFTAILSTFTGLTLGATSGFYLGKLDEVIQRFTDFMMSIPALPILILLSFLFRPSIWNLVLLLALFGWMGVCKVTRSMAMQFREEKYVEAARSLGASNLWIITHHVLPQLLPYTFAQVALSVPSAIISEAALSFLGLGDPTIVTWGRLLHDAQIAGAALNNYWWWVITPGLLIALVASSFSLLGNALDKILHPKLRR